MRIRGTSAVVLAALVLAGCAAPGDVFATSTVPDDAPVGFLEEPYTEADRLPVTMSPFTPESQDVRFQGEFDGYGIYLAAQGGSVWVISGSLDDPESRGAGTASGNAVFGTGLPDREDIVFQYVPQGTADVELAGWSAFSEWMLVRD